LEYLYIFKKNKDFVHSITAKLSFQEDAIWWVRGRGRGRGQWEEMAQTMYAYMNK
jgi:hypothetical protein